MPFITFDKKIIDKFLNKLSALIKSTPVPASANVDQLKDTKNPLPTNHATSDSAALQAQDLELTYMILGDGGVGKTALAQRFLTGAFLYSKSNLKSKHKTK